MVLRLHDPGGILGLLRHDAVEVVVGERLRHRVHGGVAADAVVQKDAAVTARRAAHVLADAIRRTRDVHDRIQIRAQVIDQRETEHRAVGAVDEECRRGGARVVITPAVAAVGRPYTADWVVATSVAFRSTPFGSAVA